MSRDPINIDNDYAQDEVCKTCQDKYVKDNDTHKTHFFLEGLQ